MQPYIPHPSMKRETLYEEVWTTPMIHLATKYGLSDQGLRKICKKLQVPLPSAGHWAKAIVGRARPRPSLPPYSEKMEKARATAESKRREGERAADAAAWKPPQQTPEEGGGRQWHRSLGALRKDFEISERKVLKLRQAADGKVLRSSPDFTSLGSIGPFRSWKAFCDNGQLLVDKQVRSTLKVSLPHYRRALTLLNTVAWRARESGYSVSHDSKNERLELKRKDVVIGLWIGEKLEASQPKAVKDSIWPARKTFAPTGRLILNLESRGRTVGLMDQPDHYLEGRMEKIFVAVMSCYDATVLAIEEAERRKGEWEAAERRRREQQRLQEEQRRLEAEERARRDKLLAEVAAWKQAVSLRAYLTELDARISQGGTPTAEYQQWREWAERVAMDLDSSTKRVQFPL